MRRESRFISNALVCVVNDPEKETVANLRDLSYHGLSIKSNGYMDIEPNSSYIIAIFPEEETNIEKFQLEIRTRWIRINKFKMESGFSVLVHFHEKIFKDYLEYLEEKYRTAAPPPGVNRFKTQIAGAGACLHLTGDGSNALGLRAYR